MLPPDLERPYHSVADVVRGLETIERHFHARRDRRGVFPCAYLHITRALEREIIAGGFRDAAWTTRYLVCFGNLYRQALLAHARAEPGVPKAWRIAFDAALAGEGLVIQHLVLGINAHINHDLALALVEIGIDPARPDKYHDHARVNEVLEASTAGLKESVSARYAPILRRLDRLVGRLDDDAINFSIPKAREHAWTFAVALTAVGTGPEAPRLRRTLDDQAAVLARLVLAAPTRHPLVLGAVRVAQRLDGLLSRLEMRRPAR